MEIPGKGRNTLGSILRRARLGQDGLTLKHVSMMLGIGIPFVSKIERGDKAVSWELAETWAMVLGIPVDDRLMEAWLATRQRLVFDTSSISVAQGKLLLVLKRAVAGLSDEVAYEIINSVHAASRSQGSTDTDLSA